MSSYLVAFGTKNEVIDPFLVGAGLVNVFFCRLLGGERAGDRDSLAGLATGRFKGLEGEEAVNNGITFSVGLLNTPAFSVHVTVVVPFVDDSTSGSLSLLLVFFTKNDRTLDRCSGAMALASRYPNFVISVVTGWQNKSISLRDPAAPRSSCRCSVTEGPSNHCNANRSSHTQTGIRVCNHSIAGHASVVRIVNVSSVAGNDVDGDWL